MKTWLLIACLAAGGGEHEKGLALYREGKFAEAAAAFRAAIDSDGDSAELQYDLALASWRAGDLAAAETAAEKYAALAKNARADLHRGLLGAIRHDEAKALEARADAAASAPPPAAAPGGNEPPPPPEDPLPILEQALAKLNQGKEHFVAGAKNGATPELLRNTERTLRYIDDLQKKIDELKKQREEQQKDDDKKDEKKDDQKQDEKGDEKKDEKGDKSEQQKKDEQQPGEKGDESKGQEGDDKPEPKPEPQPKPEDGKQPKPEPKDGADKPPEPKGEDQQPDSKPEPKPTEPRTDAPGENVGAKELSPEQAQRLMEQLKDLDQKLRAVRARAKSSRPPVERDW